MGYRLDKGGHIDRSQQIHFRWNGRKIPAFAGDTVASALLANDVAIVGRGMKLHRPRGVFSIGPEEPNAFVSLGRGAELEPSARATMIPVREGLEVRAQNAWPSVGFDLGRTLDRTAGLWHAGFYNKTFMWPSWDFWEGRIRRMAGIAKAPRERDPARYDAVHAHCDLLVVGGGPAGLLAAQVASRAGLRVMLAEQDFECGGRLLATNTLINDAPVITWFASVLGELAASRNVTLLTATTCFGLYDHGMAGLLQRLDLGNKPSAVRQRYWRVHARQTLLATGAIEQPLVFEQNDLPGIMLSGAIRQYANRYGVAAGKQIVLATNNDSAYLAALDLVAAGAPVALVLDSRTEAPADLAKWLRAQHVEVRSDASVVKAIGRKRLERVQLSAGEDVDCDALGVSGGWQPAVHLWSHARASIAYDETRRSFRPEGSRPPLQAVGSLNGCSSLDESFADTMSAIRLALEQIGRPGELQVARPTVQEAPLSPEVAVPPPRGRRQDGPPVARLPARRHGRRRRDRARRRLRTHRAPEALHDLRHGGRPGQDQQPECAPDRRFDDGQGSRGSRHDDFPSAVHAGDARRARGATGRRSDTHRSDCCPRMRSTRRSAPIGGKPAAGCGPPATRRKVKRPIKRYSARPRPCAPASESSTPRRSARSRSPAPMLRSSSSASTSTTSPSSTWGACATGSCSMRTA